MRVGLGRSMSGLLYDRLLQLFNDPNHALPFLWICGHPSDLSARCTDRRERDVGHPMLGYAFESAWVGGRGGCLGV